jgi:hypothetical protein
MDLSADGSGLIPSDLNTERGLMGCLIVNPHCSGPTSSLPQMWFPLLTLGDLLGLSGSRVNRVLTARIANGRVEKVLAMDGRRGTPRFRVSPEGGRSIYPFIQSDNSRGPTGQAVQSTRTGQTPLT